MWTVPRFVGDDDAAFREEQSRCYSDSVGYLFGAAWYEWKRAHRIVNGWQEEVVVPNRLDERTLQDLHDMMAAEFRRGYLHAADEADLIDLPADRWMRWFKREVKDLCQEADFVRSICLATREEKLGNPHEAMDVLHSRYPHLIRMMAQHESKIRADEGEKAAV